MSKKTKGGAISPVHPYVEGVPVRHKEPLSDVELGVVDEQRPLCGRGGRRQGNISECYFSSTVLIS